MMKMLRCLAQGFIATMLISMVLTSYYMNPPSNLAIAIAWFCFYLAFMLLDKSKRGVVQ